MRCAEGRQPRAEEARERKPAPSCRLAPSLGHPLLPSLAHASALAWHTSWPSGVRTTLVRTTLPHYPRRGSPPLPSEGIASARRGSPPGSALPSEGPHYPRITLGEGSPALPSERDRRRRGIAGALHYPRRGIAVADGSEAGLGAPPATGIGKPVAGLTGRGVADPGHPAACADHGQQAIIVGRRPCAADTSLAGSSDGVLAANSQRPGQVRSSTRSRFPRGKENALDSNPG